MDGRLLPPDPRSRLARPRLIPQELLDKLPDVSGAVFPSLDQLNAAKDLITANWDTAVGADVQAAP